MTYTREQLPFEIRFRKPHVHATRITGTRTDGLPDGVHTGGAYRVGDEVWKALDGRPFANATFHETTLEAEALEALQHLPAFPKNWRIETANDRRWLVRPFSMIGGRDFELSDISKDDVLYIEHSVREANRLGWEINDCISVGYDPAGCYFIIDMSSANYTAPGEPFCNDVDDTASIEQFMAVCGMEHLVTFRKNARDARADYIWKASEGSIKERMSYRHVYASFSRPLTLDWARLPDDAILQHTDAAIWSKQIPWTWVFTKKPLPSEMVNSYELRWGWSVIH